MFDIKKHNVLKNKSAIVTFIVGLILAIMVASVTYLSLETANYNEERHLPAVDVIDHDGISASNVENQELYKQNIAVKRHNTIVRIIVTIVVFAVILFFSFILASISDKNAGKLLAGIFFALCLILAFIIFMAAPYPHR